MEEEMKKPARGLGTDPEEHLAPGNSDVKPEERLVPGASDMNLEERFVFREIRQDEAGQTAEIERICFPPREACSEEMMRTRIAKAPEMFLVAVDRHTGRIAGFLNGLSTDEQIFRDEFFTDAELYDPEGKIVMLLGLDVLPEYRGRGLARELMRRYLNRERAKGRQAALLTCLDSKVDMYERMGFRDLGISASSWGGEQWHEMRCVLGGQEREEMECRLR